MDQRHVRDLRRLTEGEAILTSNGRPIALMIGVDGDSLVEALEVLRRARGLQALRSVRRAARSAEVDSLGTRKIEALIRKTRGENRRRR